MNSEVAWVLISSGTQVHPQIILETDYLPDCLSVSYDYASMESSVSIFSIYQSDIYAMVRYPKLHISKIKARFNWEKGSEITMNLH